MNRLIPTMLILAAGGLASAAFGQACGNPWSVVAAQGPSLSGSYDAAMAFDSARARLILFLGGPTAQTWEWDGSGAGAWLFRTSAGPQPRNGPSMSYDSVRHRTVLYGGRSGSTMLTDTWEWDGNAWTQVATANHPPASLVGGMAFDAARARTVYCGDQTWEYDGADWAFKSATVHGTGLAFEPSRSRVVVVDLVAPGIFDWDGASWTRFSPSIPGDQPAYFPRASAGPAPGHLLLLGVNRFAGGLETWEYDSAADTWGLRALSNFYTLGPLVFDGAKYLTPTNQGSFFRYDPALSSGPTISSYPLVWPGYTPSGSSPVLSVVATGSGGLTYQWRRNDVNLTDGGIYSGTATPTLTLTNVGIGAFGNYSVLVSDSCGSIVPHYTTIAVQCYANCDGNGYLNANDFQCFLNIFAAWCGTPQDCYVNCDHSTAPPFLNANDFQCYLNAYAAGCT